MAESDSDDFRSVAEDVVPSPSGSASGSIKNFATFANASGSGVLSPMQGGIADLRAIVAPASSQASSPETASPEVPIVTAPNGRHTDKPVVEAATPDPPSAPDTAASSPEQGANSTPTPPPDTRATVKPSKGPPEQSDSTQSPGKDLQRLAQMIIRDKETGKEYMLADLGEGTQLSSQRLVNLSTNETLVLQYDTLDVPQGLSGTSSKAPSTGANTLRAAAEATAKAPDDPEQPQSQFLARKSASSLKSAGAFTKKAWTRAAKAWLPLGVLPRGAQAAAAATSSGGGAGNGPKSSSAHLDAQSLDGAESEASSPTGSQASESSVVSMHSTKTAASQSFVSQAPVGDEGVQVVANKKVFREFTGLRVVQEWQAHAGVIWTVAFSDTGAFMATGGKDRVIRVWENRRAPVEAGAGGAGSTAGAEEGPGGEVFRTPALKEFFGHQDDVFDLSWSGNLFLLSASRDKTCILWHLYSDAALKTFKHDDSVMAAAFHPVDTRHFVTAAWNGKVRLQCANPPRVVDWKQMQLLDALPIHCMRFNGRGDKVSVGSLHGRVRQYRVLPSLKLEHHAEIDVREKSKRRLDVPVTGLDTLPQRPEALLVTTRDSRVRLYNGPVLSVKYKGLRNKSSRIPATLSSDGTFVICGSDDGIVFIWRTDTEVSVCLPRKKGSFTPSASRIKSDSYEAFRAAQCMVTVAAFAPVVPDASLPHPCPFQGPTDPRASAEHSMVNGGAEEAAASPKSVAAVQQVLKSFKIDPKTGTKDAVASARAEGCKLAAFGQVIVVASIDGMIQLFENVGSPRWL